MLIVFAGLPGTGKTTIARQLAQQICATYLRIDSIEQQLRDSRPVSGSLDDVGYRVAYKVAEDNLRLGRIVVADSVNPIPLTRDAWRAVAERAQVTAVELELVCSDWSEHRRRVESRIADIPGLQLPTWQQVLDREYVETWNRSRNVVDTAGKSVQECVDVICDLLRKIPRSELAGN